ncbi:Hypothetical protein R9X50_00783900 [Acrodontium crateriforme]|uniref:Rhodopsin domain-containing protein n=1 Tax=Acrodontium crateriforme TaxID=150365 RepID=A0AAQ3MC20_9PEZI|nr:Hypothetical protein R9X50_00783900 [Acrodontium crateriforme]
MLPDPTKDHGVYVTLAGAFFMSLSFLSLAVRIMSRWPIKSLFGIDDTLAVIATLLSLIQGTIVLVTVDKGLGKIPQLLSSAAIAQCARLIYAADLIFVLAVYASNVSVAVSLYRFANLTKQRHRQYIKILTISCGVLFVLSFIVLAVQRGAPEPQLHHSVDAVKSTAAAWIIYVILGGSLNLAIAIYPSYLVYDLQMPTRDKWKVGISYGLRMLLVPICALRIRSLALADRSNFPYGYAYTEIFTQAEMCYALISAALPCLRPFLVLAKTGLFDLQKEGTYTHNSGSVTPLRTPRAAAIGVGTRGGADRGGRNGSKSNMRRYRDDGPARGRSQTVSSISAGASNMDELIVSHIEPGQIEIRQKIEIHRS